MYRSSTGSAVMRIFITLLGIALILWGVGRVVLGLVGERSTALVTNVRRQGGERPGSIKGRYTYIVSYSFKLPDGKSYDSSTTRIGDAIYIRKPNTTTPVRYLKSFPGVNSLEEDTKPSFGQLVLVVTGGFLIFAMNKQKFGRRRKL